MRPENWPSMLDDYVQAARRTPFAWGTHDCVSWTCGWHALMTGEDVYAPFRGLYDSEQRAFRVMLDNDVHGMEQAGRFLFGEPMENKRLIARGDIVYSAGELGICLGGLCAFVQQSGLGFTRSNNFETGWSV